MTKQLKITINSKNISVSTVIEDSNIDIIMDHVMSFLNNKKGDFFILNNDQEVAIVPRNVLENSVIVIKEINK
jgi:hypothetical protein